MRVRSWPVVALLVLLPLVCWLWIIVLARDMYGPMTGASAWMMSSAWDGRHLVLLWLMWAVMMVAMMLPSAAPTIYLAGGGARSCWLAFGYVSVWAVFSVAATGLQWLLARLLVVTPMMEVSSRGGAAALLAVAGVYQWTPLKGACLATCQAPMAFLTRRWRSGHAGAVRMGVEHGAACVGCCWALMLLLFAGGVMNLAVIAALTLFVAFEKLAPLGPWGPRVSGAVLLALAVRLAL